MFLHSRSTDRLPRRRCWAEFLGQTHQRAHHPRERRIEGAVDWALQRLHPQRLMSRSLRVSVKARGWAHWRLNVAFAFRMVVCVVTTAGRVKSLETESAQAQLMSHVDAIMYPQQRRCWAHWGRQSFCAALSTDTREAAKRGLNGITASADRCG